MFNQRQHLTLPGFNQRHPVSTRAVADGCLLNSREKGIEHAGHTVWVANSVSQA